MRLNKSRGANTSQRPHFRTYFFFSLLNNSITDIWLETWVQLRLISILITFSAIQMQPYMKRDKCNHHI